MRCLVLVFFLVSACADRGPGDDYRDYRKRTESARNDPCAQADTPRGMLADVSGVWLIRALLNGGISLGLRIEITPAEGETNIPPRRIQAKFWLHDQAEDLPPLVITDTSVDENGQFIIIADPLELGPEVLGSEANVAARVELHGQSINSDEWCGVVIGSVVSPLNLNLDGSTFGARRLTDGLNLEDVPFRCPGDPCAPDAAAPPPDAQPSDAGVQRPARPDFSVPEPSQQDLTGDWFLQASLGGLPLGLWISLNFHAGDEPLGTGSIDGALRLATDPVHQPARLTFTTTVDELGRFDLWLPGIILEVNTLVVEGDVLLSAASFDDGWCGIAAGQVISPFPIDLAGSTFGAIRWQPGGAPPAEPLTQCP